MLRPRLSARTRGTPRRANYRTGHQARIRAHRRGVLVPERREVVILEVDDGEDHRLSLELRRCHTLPIDTLHARSRLTQVKAGQNFVADHGVRAALRALHREAYRYRAVGAQPHDPQGASR